MRDSTRVSRGLHHLWKTNNNNNNNNNNRSKHGSAGAVTKLQSGKTNPVTTYPSYQSLFIINKLITHASDVLSPNRVRATRPGCTSSDGIGQFGLPRRFEHHAKAP
jgi:hypothetical protein